MRGQAVDVRPLSCFLHRVRLVRRPLLDCFQRDALEPEGVQYFIVEKRQHRRCQAMACVFPLGSAGRVVAFDF